jgi:hypothetical protein
VNIGYWTVAQAFLPALLIGCAPLTPPPPAPVDDATRQAMQALNLQVEAMSGEIGTLRSTLEVVRTEQQALITELDLQNRALGRVEGAVTTLPDSLKRACPPQLPAKAQCDEPQVQRVNVSGNKMVVGEQEQVWLEPPGLAFDARIETATSNNALRADEIVEFERDGKAWVRFVLVPPDGQQRISLERRVVVHRRAFQTTEGASTKRPVVKLRLRLGDVEDTFSFVLVERGDVDYQVLLGRSFLKDIAYLEIGARYVQPRTKPKTAPAKPAATK